jgi:hypothetical protein
MFALKQLIDMMQYAFFYMSQILLQLRKQIHKPVRTSYSAAILRQLLRHVCGAEQSKSCRLYGIENILDLRD